MTINHLVTGAGRGIGHSFILELAQRPDVRIFATVRDTAKATALREASDKYGNITTLTWRADVPEDSAKLADAIRKEVDKLDVVIANAGVNTDPAPVLTASLDTLFQDFTINTAGPLHLFQAVYPLLAKSTANGSGVFLPITSLAGSIAECPPFLVAAYGASKAALNFLGKRIAVEHEDVRVLLVHPGMVKTDMAKEVMSKMGITDDVPGGITPAESAASIVGLIDTAEKYPSGSFINEKGETIPW